jgi:hypothetical protein
VQRYNLILVVIMEIYRKTGEPGAIGGEIENMGGAQSEQKSPLKKPLNNKI